MGWGGVGWGGVGWGGVERGAHSPYKRSHTMEFISRYFGYGGVISRLCFINKLCPSMLNKVLLSINYFTLKKLF